MTERKRGGRLRLMVHDYAGHAFPVQLSRWLARQGHRVLHCYSADFESPHGALAPQRDDPCGLTLAALGLGLPVPKYQPLHRWRHERRYAALVARRTVAFRPDVVLSGNAPPAIQAALLAAAHDGGGAFLSWLQDIISLAAAGVLRQKVPVLGGMVAELLRRQEFRILAESDGVVAITPDFIPLCVAGGVAASRIHVIPNWAPLDELPVLPADNGWVRRQGLSDKQLLLYSGTLGLKHNPALLAALAQATRDRPDVVVVVASQGLGRQWLERAKAERGLDNLYLLDFQDYGDLPAMLAGAAVAVAILEPYAGELSVPSKVLAYLCAGRPILAAVPLDNLAARTITQAGAGIVVAPDDPAGFVAAAQTLLDDRGMRERCGKAARAWAERKFDIDAIGGKFLDVITACR
ncbi:conserved hypothetical protein [Candidatus Terasakiella magnetica]|nr:conserved hypothetical protein [Candidatus Terasakiella magnetica]